MYKNNKKTKVLGLVLVFYCLMLIVPVIAEENLFGDMELKDFHPSSILISEVTVTIDYASGGGMIHRLETGIVAPLIFQSKEDMGKVALYPPDSEEADKESFGIQSLVGDKHYLIENTTDNVYTTLNITDNFDINSYYYLLFEDLMSKDSNTQISLKISFGKTAVANISDSSETYNKTLINNEVIPLSSVIWYCLPLETNNTFPYVIHIEASNIDVSGYYVFQFDNDKLVYDARYCIIFIDSFSNQISAAGEETVEIFGEKYKVYTGTHDYKWFLPKNSLISELNSTTILNIPAELDAKEDVNTRIVGWRSKAELEDQLKETWKQQLIKQGQMTENDKIIDYNITNAYWKYRINTALAYLIQEELQQQLKISSSYQSLVTNTLRRTIPLMGVSTDGDDFDIVKTLVNGKIKTDMIISRTEHLATLERAAIAAEVDKPPIVPPTTTATRMSFWDKFRSDIIASGPSDYDPTVRYYPRPTFVADEDGHVDKAPAGITSIPQDLKSKQTTNILIILGGSILALVALVLVFKFGFKR